MGTVISNNKQLSLSCPICMHNHVKVLIKGSIDVDVLYSTKNGGINMVDSFIQCNFSCPICGSMMKIFRDAINRIIDIIESMVHGLVVETYTNPKLNGVKVISDILVEDYTYPSLVIVSEENETWNGICNAIESIIKSDVFNNKLEVYKNLGDVKGAIFIKINEEKFNNYFIEREAPMNTFVTVAEEYFFDLIDLLASELENVYNSNNKGEK